MKILKELSSQTSHTLEEILAYCRKDYPQACEFLSRNIERFQQASKDKHVMKRATKRISAKARVLADAMAGTDYDLAFSTSIKRCVKRDGSHHPNPLLIRHRSCFGSIAIPPVVAINRFQF